MKREDQLTNLFDNLPNTPEEFNKQLDSIKTDLSKRLTQKEIKELIELNNQCSLQAQVLQQV
ncbi:MAG: hypothetical protein GBAus27B_000159 [Mycoplasmataceae bacterium]|nr:MAG: hypothetical protein GBAus27B_000159 [Mycoplasmataceae bacterium]